MNLISYIDPGSTALIWQILAGVLIVFGVVLGIWWTKITTFFKSVWAKLSKKDDNDDISEEEQEALDELSDDEEHESLPSGDDSFEEACEKDTLDENK